MTLQIERRWQYGGTRPPIDVSRIRPTCLGRVSGDPLVFCQNTPRPGQSVCEECKRRNNRLLEDILRAAADKLIEEAWKPYADNVGVAIRLGDVCGYLRAADLSTIDIKAKWKERFEAYKAAGGHAPWREIKGGHS